MNGKIYAQVFANKAYFAKVYPIDSKSKVGDALKRFYQEFGVTEKLNFYGSKEQVYNGTTFMKEVCRQCIDYHIRELDLHNHNTVDGFIRELRRKWYHTMVKTRVPRKLWDYGVIWLS